MVLNIHFIYLIEVIEKNHPATSLDHILPFWFDTVIVNKVIIHFPKLDFGSYFTNPSLFVSLKLSLLDDLWLPWLLSMLSLYFLFLFIFWFSLFVDWLDFIPFFLLSFIFYFLFELIFPGSALFYSVVLRVSLINNYTNSYLLMFPSPLISIFSNILRMLYWDSLPYRNWATYSYVIPPLWSISKYSNAF